MSKYHCFFEQSGTFKNEFKKYDGVYVIIGVEQFMGNDKFYYKLDGVPAYGTDDTIEKVEDK